MALCASLFAREETPPGESYPPGPREAASDPQSGGECVPLFGGGMSYYIGTDIGGTFTDLVMLSDDGEVTIVKSPTTPSDRTQGVLNALGSAAQQIGIPREELINNLKYFAHGTTAATNAFIERKGVKTGLLITRGFADTLRIQRCMASWAGLADHEIAHFSQRRIPVPIIALDLIEQIAERVDESGDII